MKEQNMTTKHTPGPWAIDAENEIDPVYQISLGQEWQAVGIRDNDGMESVISLCHPMNAVLIAAAPELLEALRECITDHGAPAFKSVTYAHRRLEHITSIARAAIAKAEESQQ